MIELNTEYRKNRPTNGLDSGHHDRLRFSFPEVHPQARLDLEFQRTLRIPDDGADHPLPPGLGCFPLRHVDDFSERVPASWREHGGVMLPMFQSEAMWINFTSTTRYPFLVKIASGKINAVTGRPWDNTPSTDPQDYVIIPGQPWLDGFCIKKGVIRQFVAAPLGAGYSVEEQVTRKAEFGGLQIIAYPMKPEAWARLSKPRDRSIGDDIVYCLGSCRMSPDMGLAPGGRMRQQIYHDPHPFVAWDLGHSSRCFVHLANSLTWRAITGEAPPTLPPTAEQYTKLGLPWFEYYSEVSAVEGSKILDGLKSAATLDQEKPAGSGLLPENESTGDVHVVQVGDKPGIVREF